VSIEIIYLQNEPGRPKVAIASIKPEIDTNRTAFTSKELAHADMINSVQYRRQWLGTRLLLKRLEPSAGEICYTEKGKPILVDNDLELSISHTSTYCAIALDNKPTGIDIELIGDRVSRISKRFLSDTEKEFALTNIHQHIIWGAKEAIFKAWSKGNVEFNTDIIIDPFELEEHGLINARFRNMSYIIRYKKLNDLMLVYIENS
jgi:4'-phosphopantetheinyl transferase